MLHPTSHTHIYMTKRALSIYLTLNPQESYINQSIIMPPHWYKHKDLLTASNRDITSYHLNTTSTDIIKKQTGVLANSQKVYLNSEYCYIYIHKYFSLGCNCWVPLNPQSPPPSLCCFADGYIYKEKEKRRT